MSCYNTPEPECGTYEQVRAADFKMFPKFSRRPVMPQLQRIRAAEELANPHGKLTRGAREARHYLRSYVLTPIEPQEPKPLPVKFALKLTTLKLTQLLRRQKKFARLASTAKYLLVDMTEGRLKSAVEAQQRAALGCFGQVTAEIKARALACEGRLAASE